MPEVLVGTTTEFADEVRKIIATNACEVSVFRIGEEYYAFSNRCLHQGGPVGEGRVMPKTEVIIDPEGRIVREQLSQSVSHLVCPWHGWEYELATGRCAGDPSLQLARYEVAVRGKDVYLVLP